MSAEEKAALKEQEKEERENHKPIVASLRENHTDTVVDFTVKIAPTAIDKVDTPAKLTKLLKVDVRAVGRGCRHHPSFRTSLWFFCCVCVCVRVCVCVCPGGVFHHQHALV